MGIFGKLTKIGLNVVTLPISVGKDLVTLGGALTDKEDPYTVSKIKDIDKTYDRILKELDK